MAITQTRSPSLSTLPFADVPDDDRRIIYASLKSASDFDGGVLTEGSFASYSNEGMNNGGDGWITWSPTTAQAESLQENAHIHLEIESTILTSTAPSSDARILTLNAANNRMYLNSNNKLFERLDNISFNLTNLMLATTSREESHFVFDFIFTSGQIITYLNGLLVHIKSRVIIASAFTEITLFANGAGAQPWTKSERIRNFYVSTNTEGFYHHAQLSNLKIYGDSLTEEGNLNSSFPDVVGVAGLWDDYGSTGTIHKLFASKGIRGGSNIANLAVSGSRLADIQALMDASPDLAGKPVFIGTGTGDVRSGVFPAGWEADYQTLIDTITALGADHIFIQNITSTAEDATDPDATSADAVDSANAALDNIVAANSNTTLINVFTLFGEHNYIASYYRSANLHWSEIGSHKAGSLAAKIISGHYFI